MARIKKTPDYLDELRNKGYKRYNELLNLYKNWKKDLDIKIWSEPLKLDKMT